jgi:integrase/recombinase XerD
MNTANKVPVALTSHELRMLLSKAKDHDNRAFVLFLVAASHGFRVSEVINLKRRNFTESASGSYLTIQRLKGSLKTSQRLLSNADPLFDEQTVVTGYIRDLKADEYLFTNEKGKKLTRWGVTYLMQQYCRWAGIPEHKCHVHVLKHTCGVLLRQTGAKLEVIQQALGHKRLDSTAQYLRVTPEEADEARTAAFASAAAQASNAAAAAMRL